MSDETFRDDVGSHIVIDCVDVVTPDPPLLPDSISISSIFLLRTDVMSNERMLSLIILKMSML